MSSFDKTASILPNISLDLRSLLHRSAVNNIIPTQKHRMAIIKSQCQMSTNTGQRNVSIELTRCRTDKYLLISAKVCDCRLHGLNGVGCLSLDWKNSLGFASHFRFYDDCSICNVFSVTKRFRDHDSILTVWWCQSFHFRRINVRVISCAFCKRILPHSCCEDVHRL